MTTIVYDGKTLAVDSQQTQGSTICGLRNKIQDVGKYWFAGCGTAVRAAKRVKELASNNNLVSRLSCPFIAESSC